MEVDTQNKRTMAIVQAFSLAIKKALNDVMQQVIQVITDEAEGKGINTDTVARKLADAMGESFSPHRQSDRIGHDGGY